MQYESTPSRRVYDNVVTPYSTAIDRKSGRRRRTIDTPAQEPIYIKEIPGHSYHSRFGRPATSIQTHTTEPLSTDSQPYRPVVCQQQESHIPKDVFSDANSQPQTPASQFHNAARRLALASAASHSETTIARAKADLPLNNCTQDSTKPHNFSRRLRGRRSISGSVSSKALEERDVTSARRDGLGSTSPENSRVTPVKQQRYLEHSASPSIRQVHQPIRSLPSDTLHRAQNFSRPVRASKKGSSKRMYHPPEPILTRPSIQADSIQSCNTPGVCVERVPETKDTATPRLRQNRYPDRPESQISTSRESVLQGTTVSTRPVENNKAFEMFNYVREEDLTDHRRQLKHWQIWLQRITIMCVVLSVNLGLALAYFRSSKHPYLLGILVFMKSKDILSTVADLLSILHYHFHRLIWPPKEPDGHWILSLICAYAETEEQIMKTVTSLATNITTPHKQVICIILDGIPTDIISKMNSVRAEFKRPYVTWRGAEGQLYISAGTIQTIPIILISKVKNAGKKDSLILGHDLFNYPRKDMPQSTRLLREEIWRSTMPLLVRQTRLKAFDFIFCTDADSTIHKDCLRKLADALCQTSGAIAGCGVLFAEFGGGWTEYSPWHLFQQFQYTFGQYVRRQAESSFGRVTCLPGCVTMIVVRPELGNALSEYARPVTGHNLLRHQVQYLGTDRRLTWCILSQNKHLRTILVPEALSETVTPSSLSHYLSQRRRWASNAYFNDFFYLLGPQQRLCTRLFAAIDIVRLTMVYYRVFNTAYFLHGLATNFYFIKIVPTLIVTKTPAAWYLLLVIIKEPILRKRLHKVLLGLVINQIVSPILSVIVFTNVLFHVGSQAWGKTGASSLGKPTATFHHNVESSKLWTPNRLARSVREAIRGLTPAPTYPHDTKTPRTSSVSTTSLKKASVIVKPDEGSTIARSTSNLNLSTADYDRDAEQGSSTSQQTPARRLFQEAYPTPSSMYRRGPRQQRNSNIMHERTPTRNFKHKSDTEHDFND